MDKEKSAKAQKEFKARMYAKGMRQVLVWVPVENGKRKVSYDVFIEKLDGLTEGWTQIRQSALFEKLLAFADMEAKKEAKRERKSRLKE
jgi:hypothetical protein